LYKLTRMTNIIWFTDKYQGINLKKTVNLYGRP
jgi:hypothetical protein